MANEAQPRPAKEKILPLFRPYTFSHKLGRLQMFEFAELWHAIDGIADVGFFGVASASRGSTTPEPLRRARPESHRYKKMHGMRVDKMTPRRKVSGI